MYELGVKRTFSAAHQLRGYHGPCETLHGHTFAVEVRVQAEEVNELGLAMDFKEIKKLLEKLLADYDHRLLNQVPPFERQNPSSENLAREFYRRLQPELPAGIRLTAVVVWESEEAWAAYSER